jgi:hypothetical protein
LYNFETHVVEESIHVKFDDKEPDNKMSELVESLADFQISKDTSEPEKTLEVVEASEVQEVVASDETEAIDTSKAHLESDEAQDGSERTNPLEDLSNTSLHT